MAKPHTAFYNKKIYWGATLVSGCVKHAIANAMIIRLSILTIFSHCKIPYILFHIPFGDIKELLNSLSCRFLYTWRNERQAIRKSAVRKQEMKNL